MTPFVLIAFRFPPYDRVGAYRWSKLCGRLARLGHRIDVLCAHWPEVEDPGWFGDVQHENVRIHRSRSFYPHQLHGAHFQHRLSQKLKAGAFRLLTRLTPAHDIASLWWPALKPAALRLLAAQRKPMLIATGAPFSSNYWASRLRLAYPGTRLIQDFRDPWLTSPDELRSSGWARRFRLATSEADALVSVTDEMSELFRRLSGHPRVSTVPNGVELAQLRALRAPEGARYDFAYIGNLFNRRDEPLRQFLAWVRAKRASGSAPRLAIAGQYPPSLRDEARDLLASGQLVLLPHLPQREAFELLLASNIALQFNGPGALPQFQTTTKLVEHAALGRPTLSLNYGGAAEDFIRQRGLGWSLRADSPRLFEELDACWRAEQQFELRVSDFDFDQTSRRYSELIESIAERSSTSPLAPSASSSFTDPAADLGSSA
jgi:glycosyltransferase involved in cell wall biosynthesis